MNLYSSDNASQGPTVFVSDMLYTLNTYNFY